MAEARAALRTVLRAVDKHLTRVTGNTLWRSHVLEEFRRHRHLSDQAQVAAKLQEAKDYAFLVRSIQEHKDLLLSYNIGIDREQVQRKNVENVAARVGFDVPTNYADRL